MQGIKFFHTLKFRDLLFTCFPVILLIMDHRSYINEASLGITVAPFMSNIELEI